MVAIISFLDRKDSKDLSPQKSITVIIFETRNWIRVPELK